MVGHDELKAADDAKESKPPKRGIMDFIEDEGSKAAKGGYDTMRTARETEFDPIRSHKDLDDGRGVKPTNNLDAPTKKAMDLPGNQGFTNGITSANSVVYHDEPKMLRDRDDVQIQKTDAQSSKGMDEYKLVKDIEEMKLKVNALESKLKQVWLSTSELHNFPHCLTVLKI